MAPVRGDNYESTAFINRLRTSIKEPPPHLQVLLLLVHPTKTEKEGPVATSANLQHIDFQLQWPKL